MAALLTGNPSTFVHEALLLNLTLALVGITVTPGFHLVRISSCFFTSRPRTSVGGRIIYLRTMQTRIQRLSAIAKRWPMQALGPAENAKTTTGKSIVVDRQWMSTYTLRVAIYMSLYQKIVRAWIHRHRRPNVWLMRKSYRPTSQHRDPTYGSYAHQRHPVCMSHLWESVLWHFGYWKYVRPAKSRIVLLWGPCPSVLSFQGVKLVGQVGVSHGWPQKWIPEKIYYQKSVGRSGIPTSWGTLSLYPCHWRVKYWSWMVRRRHWHLETQ